MAEKFGKNLHSTQLSRILGYRTLGGPLHFTNLL